VAADQATIPLRQTTTIRWRAVDRAGNEELQKRAEIIFDRTRPTLRIEPPPGAYSGQLTVRVSADEAATLYWSVDGTPPRPGAANTKEATLPANIALVLPTELRMLAIDLAGNEAAAGPSISATASSPRAASRRASMTAATTGKGGEGRPRRRRRHRPRR
jgi:hypothetical protein